METGQGDNVFGREILPHLMNRGDVEEKTAVDRHCSVGEASFRLPSQDSSSSEEASGDDDDKPLVVLDAQASFLPPTDLDKLARLAACDRSQNAAQSHSQRFRLSVDSSVAASVPFGSTNDTPGSEQIHRRKNPKKRTLAVLDTPNSPLKMPRIQEGLQYATGLSNTQNEECETIVCAVCLGHESSAADPIILCDGVGNGTSCDVAVHVSCYSADVDLDNHEKEWRCDRCAFSHARISMDIALRTEEEPQCCLCGRGDGALKLRGQNQWKHLRCTSRVTRLKQIRRCKKAHEKSTLLAAESGRALLDLPCNVETGFSDSAKRKRRKEMFQRFIDDEADVDSDGNSGDAAEEADALAMEEDEEEFARDFINDSSQLGFTLDELDRADLDTDIHGYSTHRALDLEREREGQFATPALNRQMLNRQSNSPWSATSGSVLDSGRGLGKMHFIRSVLEHHRNGGRAEEIEEFYQQLEKGESVNDRDE